MDRYTVSTIGYGVVAFLAGVGVVFLSTRKDWLLMIVCLAMIAVSLDNFFCGTRAKACGYHASGHYIVPTLPEAQMTRVLIDTNMLLVPGQFKVDVFSEIDRVMDEPYELVILQGSLKELKKLEKTASGEDKRAARLATMLVDHQQKRDYAAASESKCKGLKIIGKSNETHVDDAIVAIAEDDTLVATNDGELKRRLLERGVRVIFLKQQQYLTVSA